MSRDIACEYYYLGSPIPVFILYKFHVENSIPALKPNLIFIQRNQIIKDYSYQYNKLQHLFNKKRSSFCVETEPFILTKIVKSKL